MNVLLLCGTRPNFVKIAPLIEAIERYNITSNERVIEPLLVHTGQHYDYQMSQVFFQDLDNPKPDVHLDIGGGSHGEQTGKILIEIEKVLIERKPSLVVVVGDVNSTLAGALAAAKLNIPVAHVEAGLRSFDRTMPEEINRLLTDTVSDYLFTPSEDAKCNLLREGIDSKKIFFVGNIMADSLLNNKDKALCSDILRKLGLQERSYGLFTLHRPSNVDNEQIFCVIIQALVKISEILPVVFPIHPRTKKNIEKFGLRQVIKESKIKTIDPVGYIDFLALQMHAKLVLTDSGGIQEETTVLGVPCLTLRENTERPITITKGTNKLIGCKPIKIMQEVSNILQNNMEQGKIPDLWDGKTADRIVRVIVSKNTIRNNSLKD